MKTKLPLLSCLSILLASVVNAQTQSGSWLRYTVKGEEFSVTLPVEPLMRGGGVDTKVRLISKPEPGYTDAAKRHGVVGTVVLKVIFAASGKVTNIRVVQGLPDGLTERAIAAARKIKFIPATKEGKFVSMWMQLEYNFSLY